MGWCFAAVTAPYVLAIDNGSQSTKVHVVDAQGAIVASAQRALRPYVYPHLGQVVHPDDDLWDSIAAACQDALRNFSGDPAEIVAVGLCTIRFCRALLDQRGELVEPVLSWMDARVSHPHKDDPHVAFVTTSSGYITHRLTGTCVDTSANYAGMWPLDPHTMRYSENPQAFLDCGMRREQLFDLVDPGELLGHVTESAAALTGIPAGLPVIATANDKAVEALGAGLDEHTVLLSLGTYIAAMSLGETWREGPELWMNYASVPHGYLYESQGIRRGMWTVSWIRDLLFPAGFVSPVGSSLEELLNAEAALAPPGSGGVMTLLDWLAPSDAPNRRGALLGFDGTQSRAHVIRSVFEGIAITMADNIEAMESALNTSYSAVLVTGGGAKSDVMMQIIADVLGRPTSRAAIDDAAGLGAAICAAVGSGTYPDWAQAQAAMVQAGTRFDPQPTNVAAYLPVRARHRAMRANSDRLFTAIADA